MVGADRLLQDDQRTLGERFRLGVLTLVSIEQNQDVQACRHSGMVWSEALLGKLQRLFRNHNGMVMFASLKKLRGLLVELPQLSACALGIGYCARQAQHGSQSYHLYPFEHRCSSQTPNHFIAGRLPYYVLGFVTFRSIFFGL
jgi:hypothetical protein